MTIVQRTSYALLTFAAVAGLAACSPSNAKHAEAEAYLRAHITDLSPTPAVLGGTFTVTNITWENDNTALVTYEDGHLSLTGRTNITSDGGLVTASQFVIVDAAEGTSASKVEERPRAKEGEMCGGIAGIQCDFDLLCQLEGAYPDATGTCVK